MKYFSLLLVLFLIMINSSGGQNNDGVKDPKKEAEATEMMSKPEEAFRADSTRLALNGNKHQPGFLKIINAYPNTQAGNLARFYAGVCYIKIDDNENAIKLLEQFKSESKPITARVYKLLGDAHSDLGHLSIGIDYYKRSAHEFEEDKQNSSEALFLAAYLADRVMEDPKQAITLYKELIEKFPETDPANDAKKYLLQLGVDSDVITGADRIAVYLPFLKNKHVGIFANQTSMVGNTHLVDTLRKLGIDIKKIFGPEHGFRGVASAGEKIGNYIDEATGIPVVSLYGSKTKPSAEDISDLDVLVFDIQDVGTRFYTYISSLQEFLETAIENHKPLLLLDRPNPNGFYVDGPVLDMKFKSFVGMQPIPINYGLTIGEYAMLLLGEKWLSEKANAINSYNITTQPTTDTPFHFLVIKCKNYTHKTKYVLPVKPSPNLPEIQSIYLYPTTCLFEGTALSEGRGTDKPFEYIGHPSLSKKMFSFTPTPNPGATKPKHAGKVCYGWNFGGTTDQVLKKVNNKIQLKWLIDAYKAFPVKDSFFARPDAFNRLAGNDVLMQQIKSGKTEAEIRKSWEPGLTKFKAIRRKYLLYDDFE